MRQLTQRGASTSERGVDLQVGSPFFASRRWQRALGRPVLFGDVRRMLFLIAQYGQTFVVSLLDYGGTFLSSSVGVELSTMRGLVNRSQRRPVEAGCRSVIVEYMTTPLHSTVTLSDPSEVLAAVPHLLGFHPTNSFVLVTVHGSRRMSRIDLALRTDLPEPANHRRFVEHLADGPVQNNKADAVMLFVIGGVDAPEERDGESPSPPSKSTEDTGSPPYVELIEVAREVLFRAGIMVIHALWTPEIRSDNAWLCYDDPDCRGILPDPKSSSVAAALAAAGSVTFDSRAELKALIAPESDEMLARRAAKLDVLSEEAERERGVPSGNGQRDLDIVLSAVARVAEGAALTEDDLLRVLLALSDSRVRDIALSTAFGESAAAAEQLWLDLVRKAPPPELADVGALLAVAGYLRGDGALAGVVLERIEEVRPDHRLGALLRKALDLGIAAGELKVIVRDAVEDARTLLDEEADW